MISLLKQTTYFIMKNQYYLRFDRGLNIQLISEPELAEEEVIDNFYNASSEEIDDIIESIQTNCPEDSTFRIYERGDLGDTTDLVELRVMLLEEFSFFEV